MEKEEAAAASSPVDVSQWSDDDIARATAIIKQMVVPAGVKKRPAGLTGSRFRELRREMFQYAVSMRQAVARHVQRNLGEKLRSEKRKRNKATKQGGGAEPGGAAAHADTILESVPLADKQQLLLKDSTARKQRLRAMDRKHVQLAQIRLSRVQALNALMAPTTSSDRLLNDKSSSGSSAAGDGEHKSQEGNGSGRTSVEGKAEDGAAQDMEREVTAQSRYDWLEGMMQELTSGLVVNNDDSDKQTKASKTAVTPASSAEPVMQDWLRTLYDTARHSSAEPDTRQQHKNNKGKQKRKKGGNTRQQPRNRAQDSQNPLAQHRELVTRLLVGTDQEQAMGSNAGPETTCHAVGYEMRERHGAAKAVKRSQALIQAQREKMQIADKSQQAEASAQHGSEHQHGEDGSTKPPATDSTGSAGDDQEDAKSTSKPRPDVQFDWSKHFMPYELHFPRACYTCKSRYTKLHKFYDQLCPQCARLNFVKRMQKVDLRGRYALVTGGRVKIGYRCVLRLLRCGAHVVVTSRFPRDTARRYALERDYAQWRQRLQVVGLDLRDLSAVCEFTSFLERTIPHLDIIINNAAQTVRRPARYYRHLMRLETAHGRSLDHKVLEHVAEFGHTAAGEQQPAARLLSAGAPAVSVSGRKRTTRDPPASQHGVSIETVDSSDDEQDQPRDSAGSAKQRPSKRRAVVKPGQTQDGPVVPESVLLSQVPVAPEDLYYEQDAQAAGEDFPEEKVDVEGQQVDLRVVNSWLLLLDEVHPTELLEVFSVNVLAPFLLNSRLKKLLCKSPHPRRYVVNVSAMEGKFYRYKGPQHPHTNMAKAALNMMTRTSAQDYATSGIFMTSVDTGWINDENPAQICKVNARRDFSTPIDEEDAAARVLDPVLAGEIRCRLDRSARPLSGVFIKDYVPCEW